MEVKRHPLLDVMDNIRRTQPTTADAVQGLTMLTTNPPAKMDKLILKPEQRAIFKTGRVVFRSVRKRNG